MIAARKRSLRRLCFYRCLSVHRGEGTCGGCVVAGGRAWLLGGVHGCQGSCVVARGMHGYWGGMHGCRGHAWLLGGICGCQGHVWFAGWDMCGCQGGMHGCQGCAWLPGRMHAWGVCVVAGEACMVAGGGGHA